MRASSSQITRAIFKIFQTSKFIFLEGNIEQKIIERLETDKNTLISIDNSKEKREGNKLDPNDYCLLHLRSQAFRNKWIHQRLLCNSISSPKTYLSAVQVEPIQFTIHHTAHLTAQFVGAGVVLFQVAFKTAYDHGFPTHQALTKLFIVFITKFLKIQFVVLSWRYTNCQNTIVVLVITSEFT